jgi:hypothetical protein
MNLDHEYVNANSKRFWPHFLKGKREDRVIYHVALLKEATSTQLCSEKDEKSFSDFLVLFVFPGKIRSR